MPPTSSGGGRRCEMRKDAVFGQWVIFSPARGRRPSDFKSSSSSYSTTTHLNSCPFCIGRERDCAPEIFRVPNGAPEWKLRVIQNLYPALHRDEEPPGLNPQEKSIIVGYGFHDVIIETPYHDVHLSDLSATEAAEVLMAYKERFLQLSALGDVEYVQVFKNHGASAGASMSHSHSQIIGMPVIPPTVSSRLRSMKENYLQTGRCGLCEAWSQDILIHQSVYFSSIVPMAASYPFEVWIVPRHHLSHFHEIEREEAVDFGGALTGMLRRISKQLNDPPFNFMIHTSPFGLSSASFPFAHWFLQIIPRLSGVGGFELGSGCYINPVFPEDAAKLLREVNLDSVEPSSIFSL
ncbi:putative galactose-1-phosphate uridyltransferase [Wolffia australiana]